MKSNVRIAAYIIYVFLGIGLICLGYTGVLDEFWSGMGSALMIIGVLRLFRIYRYSKQVNYREKVDIEMNDERNRFIRNKAWAWAGYLFILIMGVTVIVLRIIGQDTISLIASYMVCLMLILYWVSYLILTRKY